MLIILVILFPTIAKKQVGKPRFCEELAVHMNDIKMGCYEVFKENNIEKRRAFFSEPVI